MQPANSHVIETSPLQFYDYITDGEQKANLYNVIQTTWFQAGLNFVFEIVSLYSLMWSGTHYIDHAGLRLKRSTYLCLPGTVLKGLLHPGLTDLQFKA